MALSKEQITNEVEQVGFKLISAEGYKNLNSDITVECSLGHRFVTNVADVRRNIKCGQCTRLGVDLYDAVPEKKGYRIIAIDQASNVFGLSIWENGKLIHARHERLLGEYPERLVKLYRYIVKVVISQWQPDELVFEDIQYQNNAMTHKVLGGVLGVCILAAEQYKIPHQEILNSKWQAEFNIKGRARAEQKKNAIATVDRLFNIVTNDDVADSILLGYYWVLKRNSAWEQKLF